MRRAGPPSWKSKTCGTGAARESGHKGNTCAQPLTCRDSIGRPRTTWAPLATLLTLLCLLALPASSAPGDLDPIFGSGPGIAITPVGSGESHGKSVAVQSDGKIVVAGSSSNGSNSDFVLVRYTATGGPDTSFGGGTGKVTTPIGNGNSVAVQIDGKIVVAGSSYNGSNSDFALVRYTTAGALDTSFGGGTGKVITPIGNGNDYGNSMALQSDGKIVVAGSSHNGSNSDFALVRYTSTGELDTSFGAGTGKVTTPIGSSEDYGYGVAVQPDGKIVVVGQGGFGIALARYTNTGDLDTSFGAGTGKVITSIGGGGWAESVAVQSDGKIVVAGISYTYYSNLALVRYTSTGELDTTFGGGTGKVTTPLGSDGSGKSVVVQNDGKIVVAGVYANYRPPNSYLALVRFTSTGALDTSFGLDGIKTAGSNDSDGQSAAVQSDGKIVVAGSSGKDVALARFTSTGALDTAFGFLPGEVITKVGYEFSSGQAAAVQSDGKIVVAGSFSYHNDPHLGSTVNGIGLVRYTSTGVPDTTFGDGGIVTTIIDGSASPNYLAVQGDGKIVVGASGYGLLRYTSTGALDTSFGNGGVVNFYIGVSGMAVQDDGRVVVTGFSYNGYGFDLAVMRYTSTWVPDISFGTDGIVTTSITDYDNSSFGRSVAVQSDGKIVVAGYSTDGSGFAVVRYTPAGELDTAFGTGGIVTTSIGNGSDWPSSVAVQSDGKIVVAGNSSNGSNSDFALLRYTSAGALDTSFGGGTGKVITPMGSGDDYCYCMVVQGDVITVAGFYSDGSNQDFALARYTSTGALDATFGAGTGTVITPIGRGYDAAYSMVVQSDGKLVVAGTSYNGPNSNFALARYLVGDTTDAPTLTAPASGSATSNPVAVSFSLPEPALANSVTLTFTGGVTRVLTLADSQGTAGAHSFSFNPADPTATESIASGGAIPDGIYIVTLSYQDALGNPAATASTAYVVIDTLGPMLSLPGTQTIEATGPDGAVVNFTPGANDALDPAPAVNVSPPSGSTFPIATTPVDVTATDWAGNVASGSLNVTVRDSTAPVVTPPGNVTVHATSPAGAVANYPAAGANDVVGVASILYSQNSNTLFPVGTTTVTVTAKDAANNAGTGSFTVTVTPLTAVEDWRYAKFGTAANSGIAATDADPDRDGLINAMEFAFGTEPNNPGSGRPALEYDGTFAGNGAILLRGQPRPMSEAVAEGTDLRALFVRRKDYAAAGLIYSVEFSANLTTWQASGETPTVLADDGSYQIVSVPFPLSVGGEAARFFRVKVSISP